jgi:hypothetical protein
MQPKPLTPAEKATCEGKRIRAMYGNHYAARLSAALRGETNLMPAEVKALRQTYPESWHFVALGLDPSRPWLGDVVDLRPKTR